MRKYDYSLIIGYLEGTVTDEEIQYLLRKVQSDKEFADAFNEIAEIWGARRKIVNDETKTTLALSRLHQRIALAERNGPEEINHRFQKKEGYTKKMVHYLAAAAAVVMLFLSFLIYYPNFHLPLKQQKVSYIEKSAGPGQKMNVTLPDGSLVVLNTLSSVKIPDNYGNENREIILKGEAWFEVEKNPDKPFIVHAGNVRTLVLGTKFNVSGYADDNTTKVSLLEGKVQVDIGKDPRKRQILKPGDQLIYTKKDSSATTVPFAKEYALSWKDNTLSFDYDSWPEAAKKISRWYDVKVELRDEKLERCKLKGSFASMPLTQVLKSLSYISGIKWEIKGKVVYLSGSCN